MISPFLNAILLFSGSLCCFESIWLYLKYFFLLCFVILVLKLEKHYVLFSRSLVRRMPL